VRRDHPNDENVLALESEILDLAVTIEDETRADDAARTLLGPLAAAGMAALALEHENRKELRLARGLVSRLKLLAKSSNADQLISLSDQLEAWLNRLEGTRRLFAPLLDAEDREQVETLSARSVFEQVVENVRPLIPGISVTIEVPSDFNLPPATFAEWHSLFQNVFVNAANATLDSVDRRIKCSAGRTGRSAWIRISDTGSGLDWQNSSELFEPFNRRINVSEERKGLGLGGMGLGLTIVRMMAEQRHCTAQFVQPEPPWSTTFQLSWSSNQ
jgi:C4-dicarboxylate-specific signal transduction histidine kinase